MGTIVSPNLSIPLTLAFRGFLSKYIKNQPKFAFSINREKAEQFADRIYTSIINREAIHVWGDYDVDGMLSTRYMVDMIEDFAEVLEVDAPNVTFTVPTREEHYGLKYEKFKYLTKEKDLIITVDNGVHNALFSKLKKEDFKKLWIVDHHPLSEEKSKVQNTINPNIDGEVKISTGLVLDYLFQTLRIRYPQYGKKRDKNTFKDLTAITLISDMADLNNSLVRANIREGLKKIESRERAIYSFLFPVFNGQEKKDISVEDIAFGFNPYFNAGPRMGVSGEHYVDLLGSREENANFKEMARRGVYINQLRKEATTMFSEKASKIIEEENSENLNVVFLEDCPIGLNGLIAGSMHNKYGKEIIVVSRNVNGDNAYMGSGRGTDIRNTLASFVELSPLQKKNIEFGGHNAAVGIRVKNKRTFSAAMKKFNETKITKEQKDFPHILFNEKPTDIKKYKEICEDYQDITQGIPLRANLYVKIRAYVVGQDDYRNDYSKITLMDDDGSKLIMTTKKQEGINMASLKPQDICLSVRPKEEIKENDSIFVESFSPDKLKTDKSMTIKTPPEYIAAKGAKR